MTKKLKVYYMTDNHAFYPLSLDINEAIWQVKECFNNGYTSGMLCSKDVDENVHAHYQDPPEQFFSEMKRWYETYVNKPRPVDNQHSHYYKNVEHLKTIDVYRVLQLFNVTNPCIQHAVKKLLVAGGRGAGKDTERDLREASDSINRALQMIAEDDV